MSDALKEGERSAALAWAVSAIERERKAWLAKHDQWSTLNDIARRHAAAAREAYDAAEKAFREVEAHRAAVGAAVADTSIALFVTSMSAGDAGWRRILTITGDGRRRPDVTVFGEPGEEIPTVCGLIKAEIEKAKVDRSIDPWPECIRCGERWVPPEGVDATRVPCEHRGCELAGNEVRDAD